MRRHLGRAAGVVVELVRSPRVLIAAAVGVCRYNLEQLFGTREVWACA
ncbi:hypothetical protein AAFP30_12165 [Gordonia sp. CPCC 205515]